MTVAQRSSAANLIAAKGQAVTLTRRTAGAYDPTTGAAAITETTQTGKGVILPFSVGLRKQAGTNITATDRLCYLSGLTTGGSVLTAPEVDDTLTDANSVKWSISEVSPLAPAGLSIIYELTLRGAA